MAYNKEASRRYYLKNKDKMNEASRKYYLEHKEHIKEQESKHKKKYYIENKEHILERTRAYQAANKDKIRERSRKYQQEHKEHINEYQRKWNKSHPGKYKKYADLINKYNKDHPPTKEQRRKYVLKYKYGIAHGEYDNLFDKQEGRCAVCGIHQSELNKVMSVDHNHTTKKVRGLLCANCNHLLGYAKDNIDTLRGAIKYLEKTNKEIING